MVSFRVRCITNGRACNGNRSFSDLKLDGLTNVTDTIRISRFQFAGAAFVQSTNSDTELRQPLGVLYRDSAYVSFDNSHCECPSLSTTH